jgi:hypothetical protein
VTEVSVVLSGWPDPLASAGEMVVTGAMSRRVKVAMLAALMVAACKKTLPVPLDTQDDAAAGGTDGGTGMTSVVSDAALGADAKGPDAASPDAGASPDADLDGGPPVDTAADQPPLPTDAAASPDTAPDTQACPGVCVVPFASDPTWTVYRSDPFSQPGAPVVGAARPVCLNASAPANCPVGAFLYGIGAGWRSNLASIPGAFWVWSPDVALDKPADLERFVFSRSFELGASPGGTLYLSADDSAEVRVNGQLVGAVGSTTDTALATATQNALTTFDLGVHLKPGRNIVSIAAQNGPARFAGCAPACTYGGNPAGVVFGGTFSYR